MESIYHVWLWRIYLCVVFWWLRFSGYVYIYIYIYIWGRVTHICVSRLTITGSDDGLSPGRRQAIIWTNAGILLIDQSHRYGRPQPPCREPAGSYDKTTRTAICFEHKTQYILIHAPYTRIVVFWHISNIPPMISQSQISCNTPTFYIAAIFVKYCYTTGSWLL